jgi:hypothetical protein
MVIHSIALVVYDVTDVGRLECVRARMMGRRCCIGACCAAPEA